MNCRCFQACAGGPDFEFGCRTLVKFKGAGLDHEASRLAGSGSEPPPWEPQVCGARAISSGAPEMRNSGPSHSAGRATNWWRLGVVGVAIAAVFTGFTWVLAKLHPAPGVYLPQYGTYRAPISEALSFAVWAFLFFMAALYGLLSLFLGATKAAELARRGLEWILGRTERGE